LVLGATNLPWSLDTALRRRFEKRIYIPLPEKEARLALLKNKLKGLDGNMTDEDYNVVADKTEGYSGSDLEILCKDSAMEPLRFA
jgi:vacuolar protein-sorting-associated protein 4